MNLKCEKLEESLTLEEQNQLLEDLMFMEALVIANQEYLKSIGKFDESKKFIMKFLNNLTSEELKERLNND
ncbi:MAG: hypothetical protein J6S85_06450 [Methanobrevibacter sp.]|nr:hypothetical protein [Methanobrevibacter sp.]